MTDSFFQSRLGESKQFQDYIHDQYNFTSKMFLQIMCLRQLDISS